MPATEYPPRNANPQTTRALLELRELILSGELQPDERLSELAIVDRLGVSRTPVRAALLRLSEEGLLDDLPGGGFAVKSFTERDVHDAIELRGTLEGMAGRFAAERGADPPLIAEARDVVAQIDAIIDGVGRNQADFARYVELNERFHSLLIRMSGSDLLAREFERMTRLPFASPSGFVRAQALAPESRLILTIAQEQHRAVLEAIEMRQGARAEGLMREHARLAHRNLRYALRNGDAIRHVKGGGLIRNAGD
ncbi:GntR family transcriptional regulator [Luteimonas sp. BDR2-5]|uniref:GntR family transcriptional regulator n=1 Tax=Proluteimonas luteida TaxID=2878685 RepID=UPI001E60EBF4|nr:GntR family transcriptional regulator [Luteimonas sp. BDR2-5]MCD9028710.1 GntR family transcriptional regulator [Luteimonas sp. BDR2-5]